MQIDNTGKLRLPNTASIAFLTVRDHFNPLCLHILSEESVLLNGQNRDHTHFSLWHMKLFKKKKIPVTGAAGASQRTN